MLSDPLNPLSLREVFSVISGTLVFIVVPGMVFARCLRLESRSFLESMVFAVILGYLSLHVLAYAIFLGKSDMPWYVFATGCIVYALWILYKALRGDSTRVSTPSPQPPSNTPSPLLQRGSRAKGESGKNGLYFLVYSLLVIGILVYYYCQLQYGRFVWNVEEGLFKFVSSWDFLFDINMLNESRYGFLPEDNPFLPGEPPFYHSWLGNLLPAFFIKCLGIDQIRAYYLWSYWFFYLAFMMFTHHLVRRFGEDKWAPLLSICLVFLMPWLGGWAIRIMAGIFIVFSTVIFIVNYFSSRRITDLVLSFSWLLLFGVRGNFLPALVPGIAVFCFQALFGRGFPKWDAKVFKALVFCSIIPLFLFWVSRAHFSFFYLPDPQPFVFKLFKIKEKITDILARIFPLLAVFAFYYFKKLKKKEPFSPLETTLCCGFAGIYLFSALAGRYMEGNARVLNSLGLAVAFPIVLEKLIPRPVFFRSLGGVFVLLFILFSFAPIVPETPLPISQDEMAMIRFIRKETPEKSVIFYNVPRYNDRPAIMASLTYRKSFIAEGERFANVYNLVLERRLYDYWDFLFCDCTREDREHFFAKYPKLDYVVEYDETFEKNINPLIGQPASVFGIPIRNKDADLFQEVYRQGSITVYKINRKRIGK